ncbi:hypothetical protein [Nocardia sp. GTS18]|uniref:hypothetical protein n=1 Tax=Nocardia sp. GTS18 TaxID=1778064 RepID=UPI001C680194|nr:hypothetical protein [Nocardia sp. GTS18]
MKSPAGGKYVPDYAGIRLGSGVMIGPKATFITMGHPIGPADVVTPAFADGK